MISFANINKQYGKQLVFVDASFQLNPGEKVGLVGPNGSGKTTLFRMVVGEEAPDEGTVSVPKKLTIGYFRQDVEEMSGRSVLDEAIAGSGRAGDLHHELEQLHRALEEGEIVTYSGDYDFYERERAIRDTNQQAAFARQQSMFAKEQRFIERFKTHAAKAAQVQSRIKALDKIEKIELPKKRHVVKFEFRVPPRSGDQVAVIDDLHKSYGSRVIYDGFSLTIRRGERWAVMGKNGAGKTTLLKMISGASTPDAGKVELGASLIMGYFAQQSLDVLDPDLTIIEQLQRDFPQDGMGSLRTLAGAFQFSGDEVDKKIRALSGGDKSRIAMARMR